MSARSPITTHVLDTSRGRPAVGVPVSLSRLRVNVVAGFVGDQGTDIADLHVSRASPSASARHSGQDHGSWELLAESTTDADGRVADLLAPGSLQPGIYRLRFDTATYFAQAGIESFFYPWAEIVFQVEAHAAAHYHVPLLLNPFGYSTYRGS